MTVISHLYSQPIQPTNPADRSSRPIRPKFFQLYFMSLNNFSNRFKWYLKFLKKNIDYILFKHSWIKNDFVLNNTYWTTTYCTIRTRLWFKSVGTGYPRVIPPRSDPIRFFFFMLIPGWNRIYIVLIFRFKS